MYKIEGNLNFKEELQKMLLNDDCENNNTNNDENLCRITGTVLTDNHVVLECGHKFNYRAIYEEIRKQKFVFKTYDFYTLSITQQLMFKNTEFDYYIRCPYCREIQFTLLPYYDDLGLIPLYGINSLDITLPSFKSSPKYHKHLINNKKTFSIADGSFKLYGAIFKTGIGNCCLNKFGKDCLHKFVTTIENTNLSYCQYHYKEGLLIYKDTKKHEKKLQQEQKKKEKQEQKEQKELKKKEKKENIVKKQEQPIQVYVPDIDTNNDIDVKHIINDTNHDTINITTNDTCQAIIKTGLNKGNPCGCKVYSQTFCKRHTKTT